jgi:hypothetical protein
VNALMIVHVAAGGVSLLAGALAIGVRKGQRLHARAGNVFAAAMVVMGVTATILSPFKPDRSTLIGGIFVCYLVGTSWWAARHRDGRAGRFEAAMMGLAVAIVAAFLYCGMLAVENGGSLDGYGAALFFANAALAALAAAFDLAFILRGKLSGAQRLGRHLWRMCVAFFFATGAFFLGQQDVMPAGMRGSLWLFVPALAPFGFMVFWIARLNFIKIFRRGAKAAGGAFERLVQAGRAADAS